MNKSIASIDELKNFHTVDRYLIEMIDLIFKHIFAIKFACKLYILNVCLSYIKFNLNHLKFI